MLTLLLAASASASYLAAPLALRRASCTTSLPVVMNAGNENFWGGKSNEDDLITDDATLFEDIEIDQAAQDILDAGFPGVDETPAPPKISPPKIDITIPEVDAVAVEDAVINTFKTTKNAINAVKKFEEENAVTEKVKGAWNKAVEYEQENKVVDSVVSWWKENEIGLKAMAVTTMLVDEVKKLDMPKLDMPKKAPPTIAKKAGSPSKKAPISPKKKSGGMNFFNKK